MTQEQERVAVIFWGIMFGTHDETGKRIVPTLANRKRLAKQFNVNPPLSWWRETWITGTDQERGLLEGLLWRTLSHRA